LSYAEQAALDKAINNVKSGHRTEKLQAPCRRLSRTKLRELRHHGISHPPHSVVGEEEAAMAIVDIQEYLKLIPAVNRAPQHTVWLTYDAEADTLYVNYKKPSHATDSEMTDEDVIIRYEGDDVIGFTVLHASTRLKKTA
jgi:uncharacterized protein YuzE